MKEYDYVFDIELDDTNAKLKLPYNLSEDPYQVAQKFIYKNELSQSFLDEIAQFIVKNTEGETIGGGDQSTYYDPFTGAGRYVPPSASAAGESPIKPQITLGYGDPFTGSNY